MMRIDSNAKTIKELLTNTKYRLDYYQREYSWEKKHVIELLNDLSNKFHEKYTEGDTPVNVRSYGHYFLGSIIISHNEGQHYIVDGQQRLTTLTLLLIRLQKLLEEGALKNQIDQLIYSLSFGVEGFNLDIPEWKDVLNALYKETAFDRTNRSESIQNIASRYSDIETYFKAHENKEQYLLCFVYWLLDNVYLVEIAAYDSRDSYMIFETVNDRGLSLTPSDMLKGYLLSNITDVEHRNRASETWHNSVQTLKQIGKVEEEEAIKAWLRSQYAENVPDFDAIGAEFHRWVRGKVNDLELKSSLDFADFIERDFEFYAAWYCRLRNAANSFTDAVKDGLEYVHYNAGQNKFTLQYPILLAPLRVEDTEEEILEKIQVGAIYLDIWIHRRIWNFQDISQSTVADLMPPIIPAVRGKSISELRSILFKRLKSETLSFTKNNMFHLHHGNRRKAHLILARMTDYVETQSRGQSSRYPEYIKTGTNGYEIEHIWANDFDRHTDKFTHKHEFQPYRDRIGGLLLLPKRTNASYNDLPYEKKLEHYLKENLLVQSLHEKTYENNPGFRQFIHKSELPFCSHSEFKKTDLDARQALYRHLAEHIWNPQRLLLPYDQEPDPIKIEENEEDNYVIPDQGDKQTTWTPEAIRDLVPPERREQYEAAYKNKINIVYTRIAELKNLVTRKTEWQDMPLKFQKYYCGFYFGKRALFGVNFYGRPKFWVQNDRYTVYPEETKLETLVPIFERAYRMCL